MREGALYSSALGVLWFTTCKSEKFRYRVFLAISKHYEHCTKNKVFHEEFLQ